MLVELSVVERRYLAVREALDTGATITDVARRYGVDRRTVHRWLLRYAAGGLGALADRGSKPDRCPHQISPEVEARIVALRRSNPGWGPRTILSKLRRELEFPPPPLGDLPVPGPPPPHRRSPAGGRTTSAGNGPVPWSCGRSMWWAGYASRTDLSCRWSPGSTTTRGSASSPRWSPGPRPDRCATPCSKACPATASPSRSSPTFNGKVFTGKLGRKPANVLFDRICLNNGVRHLLTAPYSPTTRGKIERLHKTMLQAFLARETFASIEQAQEDLARWVQHYSHRREHQGIGDVAPIRRFELAMKEPFDVVDGEVEIEQVPQERPRVVARRVDQAGRISILKHRYHVGRYLAGEQVAVESKDGLLHVAHNGVAIATHARRHLLDDDDKMDRRPKNPRPQRPTTGGEVLRQVDASGSVSFAGCGYRVGNRHRGQTVDVRLVGDTIQITRDGQLLRTHRARHDKSKEFGALAKPTGRPRRNQDVA